MDRRNYDTSEYRKAIREEMRARGLTVTKIAELLKVDRAFVSNILNLRKKGWRLRARMVRELGFPLWLLDDPPAAGARRAA